MEEYRDTPTEKEVINFQVQCVCGCDQFEKLPIRIQTYYEMMTFRVCKKCGTLKMGYGYYNQLLKEYGTIPLKQEG